MAPEYVHTWMRSFTSSTLIKKTNHDITAAAILLSLAIKMGNEMHFQSLSLLSSSSSSLAELPRKFTGDCQVDYL